MFLRRGVGPGEDCAAIGDVELARADTYGGIRLPCEGLGLGEAGFVEIGKAQVAAASRERDREFAAETRSGAGDRCDFVGEVFHAVALPGSPTVACATRENLKVPSAIGRNFRLSRSTR